MSQTFSLCKMKKILFVLLFLTFLVYTLFVDTAGTAMDKGAAFNTAESQKGKLLFQKYNCIACHQLYGLGGYMGPDLTNILSDSLTGTNYAYALLSTGSNKMPDFRLSDAEKEQLLAYLHYVDKTGISPAKHFDVSMDGTVTLKP
jgi:nitric oxide reductase subunit C